MPIAAKDLPVSVGEIDEDARSLRAWRRASGRPASPGKGQRARRSNRLSTQRLEFVVHSQSFGKLLALVRGNVKVLAMIGSR